MCIKKKVIFQHLIKGDTKNSPMQNKSNAHGIKIKLKHEHVTISGIKWENW